MRALIINCSPVRTGATADSAKLLNQQDQYERFMKDKEKQS